MQNFGRQQQFFATGAAAVELNRREHTLFVQAAVQVDLGVASAFELFKNHFVHAAARVDQGGGDDGQRSAFFDVASRTQEALGALQRVGINAAGQHLAA